MMRLLMAKSSHGQPIHIDCRSVYNFLLLYVVLLTMFIPAFILIHTSITTLNHNL